MRGRHLLNPLLSSSLSYPKPPPARLATGGAGRRSVAQPPATRRDTLAEPDVGISRFASALPGFRGALKQRYSDFVVHEVALDGSLVRLTSFDLPDDERVDVKEGDVDEAQALESFQLLCGDADFELLRRFLERVSEGGDNDVSPIILSADVDKAHRSDVHDFFKRNFGYLITDTVEHSDGIQRCIRVRLRPGWRDFGGRGRNWKGTGSSGWRDDRQFDSRGSTTWPYHLGKFLRFHLYKENKDTQEALGTIGKMLGLQPRSFGFAGTKDKRAVTTQQVTLFKVQASRLVALNRKLIGIKVGDFSYVKEGLVLGQLMGNRFTITLRGVTCVGGIKSMAAWVSRGHEKMDDSSFRFELFVRSAVAESEDVIKTAVDGLIKNGFINYYGLQRFGCGSVPTHLVGAALLRGEWRNAVRLILDPREGGIGMALRNFPRYLITERAILQRLKKYPGNYLQAIMAVPRTLRLMYVHSYQSYLWNHAASMRVEKYGISQVVEGDLVYRKESPFEGAEKVTSEDDDHTNSSEMNTSCETLPEMIQSVKIVDSEDLLKLRYTFEDVVLPLPGSQTLFPGNEVAGIYHEIAKKDGINLRKSVHGVKDFCIINMKGGYRRVIQRPIDFEWDLITYTDEGTPLVETDLDVMSKTKQLEANELLSNGISSCTSLEYKVEASLDASESTDGASLVEAKPAGSSDLLKKLAVKLAFTLPASSYATMAIRELTKTSTSVAHQKTLNI